MSARYGAKHQALRAKWEPIVARGEVDCWRCGQRIQPDDEWDLGHGDGVLRDEHRGPEHRGRCNRATSRHKAEARKRKPRRHPSDL